MNWTQRMYHAIWVMPLPRWIARRKRAYRALAWLSARYTRLYGEV